MKKVIACILCIFICISVIPANALAAAPRDTSFEEGLAAELKNLGLFKGVSDTEFELGRAPSRTEALVMLIRILGKEDEAIGGSWTHPFTDVPGWANKYVGYAYANKLTNGISATQFGAGDASATMYLTFVLRALGYSDDGGTDFTWNDPFTLAGIIGIIPEGVSISEFWRADVVLISFAALNATLRDSNQTLGEKLIEAGAFTQEQFGLHYDLGALNDNKTILDTEQIFALCAPAVFYIEVFDEEGDAFGTGSGFFIHSSGIAVTNYHVIKDAYSARITTSDDGKVYDVLGLYDYSEENDWAVIKVDGSGFPYLKKGNASTIIGGAAVCAIGSPLGLQNTITEGLISNPARVDGETTYIQTSAAISPGSSGGALINKYGEVIGITSASYINGQNLNLALPITYIDTALLNDYVTMEEFGSRLELSGSSSQVLMTVGSTEKVFVCHDGSGEVDLSYSIADDSIAAVIECTWLDEQNVVFTISGIGPGVTELTVDMNGSTMRFTVTVTREAIDPMAVLGEYATEYGTYNNEDNYYTLSLITESDDGGIGYYVNYKPADGSVVLTCVVDNGSDVMVYTDITINMVSVSYPYYVFIGGYEATTNIAPDSVNENTFLNFFTYDGDPSDLDDFRDLSSMILTSLLDATEYIFILYEIPLSIIDFGFVAEYNAIYY